MFTANWSFQGPFEGCNFYARQFQSSGRRELIFFLLYNLICDYFNFIKIWDGDIQGEGEWKKNDPKGKPFFQPELDYQAR